MRKQKFLKEVTWGEGKRKQRENPKILQKNYSLWRTPLPEKGARLRVHRGKELGEKEKKYQHKKEPCSKKAARQIHTTQERN